MKKQEMTEMLTKQAQDLRQEIIKLQETFNLKKDQLIRIEGALEALSVLETTENLEPNSESVE